MVFFCYILFVIEVPHQVAFRLNVYTFNALEAAKAFFLILETVFEMELNTRGNRFQYGTLQRSKSGLFPVVSQ